MAKFLPVVSPHGRCPKRVMGTARRNVLGAEVPEAACAPCPAKGTRGPRGPRHGRCGESHPGQTAGHGVLAAGSGTGPGAGPPPTSRAAPTSCVSSGRWSPFLRPSLISRSRYRLASGLSESFWTLS